MLDDLLDMTASEAELGKPVGNDLRERKMTIPLILALENATPEFRARLERYHRDPDGTGAAEAIRQLVADVTEAGGLVRTREAIGGYVERAKLSLVPLGDVPARSELSALADALSRDSIARTR